MGVEALKPIWDFLTSIFSVGSNTSTLLAIVGFGLVVIVLAAYLARSLIKFGKMLFHMEIKEFSLFILALGVIFLVLAVILP